MKHLRIAWGGGRRVWILVAVAAIVVVALRLGAKRLIPAKKPIPSSIHLAARLDDVDGVAHHLQHGVDINIPDSMRKQTALHHAAERGHEKVVQFLLSKAADTEVANYAKETPLHMAAENDHESVVRLLLAGGAKTDSANNCGCQPLHLAALRGHTDVIRLLIGAGADVNAKAHVDNTPLHYACGRNRNILTPSDEDPSGKNKTAVVLLLDNGADVTAADNNGWTALHNAARNGYCDAAAVLLKRGAKIDARSTGYAVTGVLTKPLEVIQVHNKEDTVYALQQGRQPEPGETHQLITITEEELESDTIPTINMNITYWHIPDRATPLHVAAVHGRTAVARLLLEAGANANEKAGIDGYWRAIHGAVENGHTEMVKLLLERGADPNIIYDKPLLETAVIGYHTDIVKLLKKYGAK